MFDHSLDLPQLELHLFKEILERRSRNQHNIRENENWLYGENNIEKDFQKV